MNIRVVIEYKGTKYFGWQKQKSHNTVQAEIEKTLKILFPDQPIKLIGASRTDRGAHAINQTAHFKIEENSITLRRFKRSINGLLPKDIRVIRINKVPLEFHSRYHCKTKVYYYYILNRKETSPFLDDYVWHIPIKLNWKKIKTSLKLLKGLHNFSFFAAKGSSAHTSVCRLKKLQIKKVNRFLGSLQIKNLYMFEFKGDFFLYKMVRNIVGTLIEIGKNRLSIRELRALLSGKKIRRPIKTAPAKGLFLGKITY